jgi:hypothetical protein
VIKKHTVKQIWLSLTLCALLGLLSASAQSRPAQANDLSTPLTAALSLDQIPLLGAAANLTCTVTSSLDAPATSLQLELPPGVSLVAGSLAWRGDLLANRPQQLTARVVFQQAGDVSLFCRALRPLDANNTWGDLAAVYLNIGAARSQAGFRAVPAAQRLGSAELRLKGDGQLLQPLPALPPQAPRNLPSAQPSNQQNAPIAPQSLAAGELTVTGRWSYYDRSGAVTGARDMLVQLVRGDTGASLATCVSGLDGAYTCGPVANPGAAGVRTVLYSFTSYAPYNDILVVVNPNLGSAAVPQNAYAVSQGSATVLADGVQSIGEWTLPQGDLNERAFWVERDLVDAFRYVWDGAAQYQSPPRTAGPVTVLWKIDSTDGTYYTIGEYLHLKGTDPLSSFPILHEYAHASMYRVYGNWFPISSCPSPHYINSLEPVNCAFTEGWANFFSMAVSGSPILRWPSGATANLELPTWGTSGWANGEGVEGRVAGALWDVLDTANDGYDTYSDGGIANIWDTFSHQGANNFAEFTSGWVARGHNTGGAALSMYQNTITFGFSPPAVPVAPTGLSASDGVFSDQVQLSWSAVSGADSYLVYRAEGLDGVKQPAAGLPTTSLGGADLWTTPGVTYYYWVKACNGMGCSDFSAAESGWRAVPLSAPLLSASDGAFSDRVRLAWAAVPGAEFYRVLRSESLSGPKTLGGQTSALGGDDLWAAPGVTYYYWAQSCNALGCSELSPAEPGWRAP